MHFPTTTSVPLTTSSSLVGHGFRAIDRVIALPMVAIVMHSLLAMLGRPNGPRPVGTDRGAVSIEQVLWYAAAAISVAVIAAIIWGQVRDTANTPVNQPSAP